MSRSSGREGFTLLELMIVSVAIGILATNTTDLAVTIPSMNDRSLPGASPNFTWSITSTRAQSVASSAHRHSLPADHQVRGTVNSDGTWVIEVKRPGENPFQRLGS